MESDILVPELLVLCAIRYAIGRRSYIVRVVAQWTIDHWMEFSDWLRARISQDVEAALREHALFGTGLGDEADAREWARVRELWCEEEEEEP